MSKPRRNCPAQDGAPVCFRLDPEARMCPQFDQVSIAQFPVAPWDRMGIRVVDNCTEEHIM